MKYLMPILNYGCPFLVALGFASQREWSGVLICLVAMVHYWNSSEWEKQSHQWRAMWEEQKQEKADWMALAERGKELSSKWENLYRCKQPGNPLMGRRCTCGNPSKVRLQSDPPLCADCNKLILP